MWRLSAEGSRGSLTAAMLNKAGIDFQLVDQHAVYPAGFRCKKLDRGQVELLVWAGPVKRHGGFVCRLVWRAPLPMALPWTAGHAIRSRADFANLLMRLVAEEGFEPPTHGL